MQSMNPENAFPVQLGRDQGADHRGTRGQELGSGHSSSQKVELCADHREQVTALSTSVAVRTAIKLHFICRNIETTEF